MNTTPSNNQHDERPRVDSGQNQPGSMHACAVMLQNMGDDQKYTVPLVDKETGEIEDVEVIY